MDVETMEMKQVNEAIEKTERLLLALKEHRMELAVTKLRERRLAEAVEQMP